MKKLKEQILEKHPPPTSSSTCDPTFSTSSHAIRSNDTYVYGADILAVLAIGVCIFFACNTFPKNKKANDCLGAQHEQKPPPKRRPML